MFYINNQPITGDALIKAVLNSFDGRKYFLDVRDGGVISVSENETLDNSVSKDFIVVPTLSSKQLQLALVECLEVMGSFEEPNFNIDVIKEAYDYQKALDLVTDAESLLAWNIWRDELAWDFVREWLVTIPGGEDRWEFDCECEICKVMQNSEATQGDYLEAFARQNQKHGEGL